MSHGLHDSGQAGIEADGYAYGNGPCGGNEQRGVDAEKSGSGTFKQQAQVRPGDAAQHEDGLHRTIGDDQNHRAGKRPQFCRGLAAGRVFVDGMNDAALLGVRHAAVDGFFNAGKDAAGKGTEEAGFAQQFENGRSDAVRGLDLLEFELVAPCNEGTPDQLIGGHDNQNYHREASQQGAHIAGGSGRLEVAAEARQLEVAIAHGEHLAGDQGKPSAGHGDDGVPHQADGGVWHFQLPEALPGRIAVDARCLDHLPGNAFERGVETKGQVPYLSGEDEQNDAHLDAHLMAGHEGHHGQHDGRQKAEHGNGLENVEYRDHPGLDPRIVGRGVAVGDGEAQAEQIGDEDTHDGVKGVYRQSADGVRDGDHRNRLAEPVGAGAHDGEEDGQTTRSHPRIDDDGPGSGGDQRSCQGVQLHWTSSLAAISSSWASGRIKRRRPASKSNNSA